MSNISRRILLAKPRGLRYFDTMESNAIPQNDDFYRDFAALDWQLEMGVDEAICESPINRYDLPDIVAKPTPVAEPAPTNAPQTKAAPSTVALAQACETLDALQNAIETFDGCALKNGARNTVFAAGNPAAKVMIIGDAPNRDEDRAGQVFIGQTGQLLDKMLAAIGFTRNSQDPAQSFYLTSIFPWRAPQNRDPAKADLDLMLPFVLRHIELAKPEVLLLMGKTAAKVLIGKDQSFSTLRGAWHDIHGTPAIAIFPPSYLLRTPLQKRAAWADLLAVKSKLDGSSQ